MGIASGIKKILRSPEFQAIIKPVTPSTPMAVDVSAEGMRKKSKTLAKGTGVTYSGVKTSSQGLLTGAITEKKTLLGG